MGQFLVRLYRSGTKVRVVIDGLTHFDAGSDAEAESRAGEAVLERLRAFLPVRAPPPVDPDAVATWGYEIVLRRVPVQPEGPRTGTDPTPGEVPEPSPRPPSSPAPVSPAGGTPFPRGRPRVRAPARP